MNICFGVLILDLNYLVELFLFQCSLSVFSSCALFYSSVQSILPVILCGWGWWIALHFWCNHYYLATYYRCFRVKNSNV